MSKQLAIAACASIFAMAAFVLSATPAEGIAASVGLQQQGATTVVAAPLVDAGIAALVDLIC